MRLITSMVLLTLIGLPLSAQSTHQKNAQTTDKTTEQKAADKAELKVDKMADKTVQKTKQKAAIKADAKKVTAKVAEEAAQTIKVAEIRKDVPAKKEEAPKANQPAVKVPVKAQVSAQPAKVADVEKAAPAINKNPVPTAVATDQVPGQKKSELTVSRAAIALNINNLEPENAGDTFPPEVKRLYCFTHIKGSSGTSEIQHRWYWNDDLIGTINLPVKSPNYRTYSAKTIPAGMVGEWMIAIVDSKNEEILKMLKIYIK